MLLNAKFLSYSCGLVYGSAEHHLDHIAPLCADLEIPLCVTEPYIKDLAKKFYPSLVINYFPQDQIANHLLRFYHRVITALPKDLFDAIFFLNKEASHQKIESLWCPHGNSDKGKRSFFTEALHKESIALVYGETMIDFFSEKKALSPNCKTIKIGSYRFNFYKKHEDFYKKKLQKAFKKLPSDQKTLLYAPTWADSEGYSSQLLALEPLLEKRPHYYNLLIKLHPNTLLSDDLKLKKLILKYESLDHVVFIENFPFIYALLDYVDVYLGDSSSIGYDMLHFQKPMLFINIKGPDFELPLFKAGKVLTPKDLPDIYSCIDQHLLKHKYYQPIQQELCDKTFSKNSDMVELKLLMKDFHPSNIPCTPYA